MRALVIREPWVGLILAGDKTWELRSRPTAVRGAIGLIRKGSGTVVGVAELATSLPSLTDAAAFARSEPFHRVPRDQQAGAIERHWITPWVLKDAKPLRRPVTYVHRPGAVVWVTLDDATSKAALAAARP